MSDSNSTSAESPKKFLDRFMLNNVSIENIKCPNQSMGRLAMGKTNIIYWLCTILVVILEKRWRILLILCLKENKDD